MPACGAETFPVSLRSSWENCPNRIYHRRYQWNRDQMYEGEFFRDGLHGEGTYKWESLGVYEGGFYSNSKEGYAVLSYPDNSCFEGLFVRNERFGPGIFTYSNGRQDAGFWAGGKLVRLSRSVDFIVPRLAPTSAAKIKLLQFRRLIPIDEEVADSFKENRHSYESPSDCLSCPYSSLIYDPRSYFFDRVIFERTYFLNSKYTLEELPDDSQNWEAVPPEEQGQEQEQENQTSELNLVPSHCLCSVTEFEMKYKPQDVTNVCEGRGESKSLVEMGLLAYFTSLHREEQGRDEEEYEDLRETEKEVDDRVEQQPKLLAWNRNEPCLLMLKEIFRYRAFEGRLSFNIAKLMTGARTAFRKTGEKEKQCLEFLVQCAMGPPQTVKEMLCEYDISVELTDARGNNSVMFAAATDQHEILDIVLDSGADVNSFNDEGLTPLNLCLLRRLAQAHDLGNWEVAFLPREIEKTEGDISEAEEWRKQISIPSLDRIFGDGTSAIELKKQQSSTFFHEDSVKTKSNSPISETSSISAPPMMSKSLINAARISEIRKSTQSTLVGAQSHSKDKMKIQPKLRRTEEFEKSIGPSGTGSYFFELTQKTPGEKPGTEDGKKENSSELRRGSDEENWEKTSGQGDFYKSDTREKKLMEIDKTIEKLLKRGADPNLSEAPKPSIHLGVYSKDWKIVKLLLSHGANPNSQLYANEGLLTPLHVLVLLKSSLPSVYICDLLLNFGTDPEVETLPEFALHQAEKPFLDPSTGRTPLQLLCMRPDLEYADPDDYLMKIALMLANASKKTRLYKGYSYLALALWFGNIKLLKILLESKCFDSNQLLGNDLGTVLHILVSTEFQRKTAFDTSIQICDLLLNANANPLKRINGSTKLAGNCIDYGYREVEAEKISRKLLTGETKKESGKKESGKKSSKKGEKSEKPPERDHLTDHVNVLEYLQKRTKEMIRNKKKRGESDENKSTQEKSKSARSIKSEREPGKEEGNEKKTDKSGKREGDEKGGSGLTVEDGELGKSDDRRQDEAKRKEKKGKTGGGKKKGKGEGRNVKFKGKKEKPKKKEGANPSKVNQSQTAKITNQWRSFPSGKAAKQSQPSESFPEKLRQSILKFLGNCKNLDLNELFLPYVVLRNGDLYYNIKTCASRGKEQYSLI